MPQASDGLRAEMQKLHGDPIDDWLPQKYLKDRGWTLSRKWTWSKPGQTLQTMPQDEYLCVLFLIREWDFGGVDDDPSLMSEDER